MQLNVEIPRQTFVSADSTQQVVSGAAFWPYDLQQALLK